MEIDFRKFKINGNLYELTGVRLLQYNGWTYDVVNRTNGQRKVMSEDKLKDLLNKYYYVIVN